MLYPALKADEILLPRTPSTIIQNIDASANQDGVLEIAIRRREFRFQFRSECIAFWSVFDLPIYEMHMRMHMFINWNEWF